MTIPEQTPAAPPRLRPGVRIALVSSSYHGDLIQRMVQSARETLAEAGLEPGHLWELTAPGAYELPLIARRLAARRDVDAVLCFGLVLRGETDHDRYIAQAVASRIMDASMQTDTPILFGVLTPNTIGQAEARVRRRSEGGLDKGREVALAAIATLATLDQTDGPHAWCE